MLTTHFLGVKMRSPIGLGPGIDNFGTCLANLQSLGFDFVEIGPLSDENEENTKPKTDQKWEIIPIEGKSFLLKSFENFYSVHYALKSVKDSIDSLNKSETFQISTNIKLPHSVNNSAPYLSDSSFIEAMNASMNYSDYITLNFSNYTSKSILQYRNNNKLRIFLSKVKKNMMKEIGLNYAIEHEVLNPPKENELSVIEEMRILPMMNMIKRKIPRIILRPDTDISDRELEDFIRIGMDSGIVDAFVIGGMKRLREGFACGEIVKEDSLKALKKAYEITQGKVSLISTGGVMNGNDIYERIKLGADFVLIYSPFLIDGPFCLEKIKEELKNKMKEEGKHSIKDIRTGS